MSTAQKRTAQQLFDEAFSIPRDPRSHEYKMGVLAALKYRLGEITSMQCPYRTGTAQADAWYSGTQEGHRRGREERERVQGFKVSFDASIN